MLTELLLDQNLKKMRTIKILILLIGTVLISSCALNEQKLQNDSIYQSDNQNTSFYNESSIISMPSEKWKFKTAGKVISSPAYYNDNIYIGSTDSYLYSIDAKDGKLNWKFKTNGAIVSTPLVSKGKILFLSYDGYFYALNIDGELKWKFQTEGESKHLVGDYYRPGEMSEDFWDFYLSSASVEENVVYFGSSDTHLYALDFDSGNLIWKYKADGRIHSTPAIYKSAIYFGDWESNIYCLDAKTGLKKWDYTTGRDTVYYSWIGIQASPSIKDDVLYVGSRDAKVYAFNALTGDTIWTQDDFGMSWMPSSFAIGKDAIYSGSSDGKAFYAIDKSNGNILYKAQTHSYTFSSPAIDHTMGYVGSANGRLYAFDLLSGEMKWEYRTIGSLTDPNKLFLEDGSLDKDPSKNLFVGFDNLPDLCKKLETVFAECGAILSSPIIKDQSIYFGSSDGYIYALENKKDH